MNGLGSELNKNGVQHTDGVGGYGDTINWGTCIVIGFVESMASNIEEIAGV